MLFDFTGLGDSLSKQVEARNLDTSKGIYLQLSVETKSDSANNIVQNLWYNDLRSLPIVGYFIPAFIQSQQSEKRLRSVTMYNISSL